MTNVEAAKIKAKSKLILWCVILGCCVIVAGVWEYWHQTQPLYQTTLIYKPAGAEGGATVLEIASPVLMMENAEKNSEDTQKDEQKPVAAATIDKTSESEKNEVSENNAPVVQNSVNAEQQNTPAAEIEEPEPEFEALQEFLIYMLELQQQLEQDVSGETVLDRIKQPEIKADENKEPASAVSFEENKIEVYDSEKGVVGVIEVGEKKIEQGAELKPQTVEKNEEPSPKPSAEVQVPTIETEQAPEEPVMMLPEVIDNAMQEMKEVVEQAQNVATEAENQMRENVQAEISRVEENGDEAPIVLIPGLQNM
jgi:hypothetical protein